MKLLFIITGAITLLIFLIPLASSVFDAGNICGMVIGGVYLGFGLRYDSVSLVARKWVALSFIIVFMLIFMLFVKIMYSGRMTATDEKVLIVLGCKVKGNKPSRALAGRVESTYKYMLCHPDSVAILSGGKGSDELISEAECMHTLLLERGIAGNRLFIEKQSTTTIENIRYSKKIIEENSLDGGIAVVSSEYHLLRARRICSRLSLSSAGIPSRTRADLLPTFLLREILALGKLALFPND